MSKEMSKDALMIEVPLTAVFLAEDCGYLNGWVNKEGNRTPVVRMKCPMCSSTYQRSTGVYRKSSEDGWGGNGDLVAVTFAGGCDAEWELCIGIHKSETFTFGRIKRLCRNFKETCYGTVSSMGRLPSKDLGGITGQLETVRQEMVHHPDYYNVGTLEVIDAIDGLQLDFYEGNIVKYVARNRFKGKAVEDLKKAAWYLERLIAIRESRHIKEGV